VSEEMNKQKRGEEERDITSSSLFLGSGKSWGKVTADTLDR